MIDCREALKAELPVAFNMMSAASAIELNAQNNMNLPIPIPMAEAWIVVKTAVISTNFMLDANFFIK
jgi:hypothetical protein